MHRSQYEIICSRRQIYDQMLWQTPMILIAAKSFLILAIFTNSGDDFINIGLSLILVIVGIASIHLFCKVRFLEIEDSHSLVEYEKNNAEAGFEIIHGRPINKPNVKSGGAVMTIMSFSSFYLWLGVMVVFLIFDSFLFIKVALGSA